MFDLCGGNINETRSIRADIKPRREPNHFPPLMPDRKAVTQDCNFAGETGKCSHREENGKTKPK